MRATGRAVRLALGTALLCSAGLGSMWAAPAYKTKHVFIVVMDGVRWQDTFGDPTHQFIPRLWNDLRPQGCLFTNFYNNGITVTRQGHSTLISGTWQRASNGGARLTMPTLFDYYRDETGAPAEKCWAIFGKGAYAFAPYSSFPTYADKFAPQFVCGGKDTPWNEQNADGDRGVLEKVLDVMKTDKPDVVFVNFGYTDHAGHRAKDVAEYQAAIRNCDELFGRLWDAIQADPYYRDTTTVFFTNDHGRHTEDFHGHGDSCEGCRHIMLLVLGPDVKKGTTVDTPALQIDVAPTAAELLGIQTPLATGRVLTECLAEPLSLNRKEAVTDTARQAVALARLASRDMLRTAGEYVVKSMTIDQVPADLAGELLARGMLRAARETGDQRFLDWAIGWIEAHKTKEAPAGLPAAGAMLDLPPEKLTDYLPTARAVGDALLAAPDALPQSLPQRTAQLWAGVFLGRLAKAARGRAYADSALARLTHALAMPSPEPSTLDGAVDLLLLGQAAWCFPREEAVGKAYLVALARSLAGMKEVGGLWADPTVSVLNVFAIQAASEAGVLRGLAAKPAKTAPASPILDALTPWELAAALGGRVAKRPEAARKTLSTLIATRARQQFPISVELLKYNVSEAGAYADGSAMTQGVFLLAWEQPAWSYGGDSPWPPGKEPSQKVAAGRGGRQTGTQPPRRREQPGRAESGQGKED